MRKEHKTTVKNYNITTVLICSTRRTDNRDSNKEKNKTKNKTQDKSRKERIFLTANNVILEEGGGLGVRGLLAQLVHVPAPRPFRALPL